MCGASSLISWKTPSTLGAHNCSKVGSPPLSITCNPGTPQLHLCSDAHQLVNKEHPLRPADASHSMATVLA